MKAVSWIPLGVVVLGIIVSPSASGAVGPRSDTNRVLPSRLPVFGEVRQWTQLSPSSTSDPVDYQVAVAAGTSGRLAVYVYGRTGPGESVSSTSKIYIDQSRGTFEAVRFTGSRENVDRIWALDRRKRPNVSREEVATRVAKRVRGHADFIMMTRTIRQRQLAGRGEHVGRGEQVPDGSRPESAEVDFGCPMGGSVNVITEDPIWIDVASTYHVQYGTRLLDIWDDFGAFGDCWDKNAQGYIWPADTEWYEDHCEQQGTSQYDSQDASRLGVFHNNDWGDDEESTDVVQQAGIQLETSGWVNWWWFDDISGEDATFLESSETHDTFSSCGLPLARPEIFARPLPLTR